MGLALGAGEIASIRSDAEELLQGDARILRRSSTRTPGGGSKETWTPDTGTVRCRIAPYSTSGGRSGGESAPSSGDRVEDRLKAWITLPWDTELTDRDRIEVTGAGTYEVLAILPRVVDRFVLRVDAREVF